MKLYIWTQVMENYGDAENPHWKAKGGGEYFVMNVSEDSVSPMLRFAQDTVEHECDYFVERVIGFRLVEDDFMTQFERDQLEYDGQIDFPAKVLNTET